MYQREVSLGQAIADLIHDQLSASNYYTIEHGCEHQVDCVDVWARRLRFRVVVNGATLHTIALSDDETVVRFWDVSTAKWWCNGQRYISLKELVNYIEENAGYWYDSYD